MGRMIDVGVPANSAFEIANDITFFAWIFRNGGNDEIFV